jgi:hypothetical protein
LLFSSSSWLRRFLNWLSEAFGNTDSEEVEALRLSSSGVV